MVIGFAGVIKATVSFENLVIWLATLSMPPLVYIAVTVALCAAAAASGLRRYRRCPDDFPGHLSLHGGRSRGNPPPGHCYLRHLGFPPSHRRSMLSAEHLPPDAQRGVSAYVCHMHAHAHDRIGRYHHLAYDLGMSRSNSEGVNSLNLLENAYDLHVHTAPDITGRRLDDFDMAERARSAGMKGFAIKCHQFQSGGRAALVRRQYPEINAVGGITLNNSVGGLNPMAVEMAARMGSKIVCSQPSILCTRSSIWSRAGEARPYGAAVFRPSLSKIFPF